jgi:hypothetical protein
MMNHQYAVSGATNVQFNTIDPDRHGRSKGAQGVLALDYVQAAVRKDVNHPMSLAGAISNYMDVTSFIRESALVFR